MTEQNTTRTGIGLGSLIAVIMSFILHQNIWQIIWHGILGWFYIIYYLIKFGSVGLW